MTEQEQQIAIAKACGWTRIEFGPWDGAPFGWPPEKVNCDKFRVPDYLHDLNAIQAAVLALPTRKFKEAFQARLNRRSRLTRWLICEFQAAVWCEEYLRTRGLWKD